MKRWIAGWVLLLALLLAGCSRYEPSAEIERSVSGTEASDVQETAAMPAQEEAEDGTEEAPSEDAEAQESSGEEIITLSTYPPRNPVKVKGIYVSAYVAGTEDRMDAIIEQIDATELNAVVIDVKDDQGRITFSMDSPTVNEIGAVQAFIGDMQGLIAKLKEHGIYPIARVVAFRDPYLAEQKPEWSLHKADGSIYRDSQGLAWVNPYKKEVWDYLIEVARKAGEIGFEEIQFDYIRFAVDSTMRDVVYDEADTQGRDKTQAIMEFITYAYDQLAAEGLFVSADVFGTIIGSQEDAASVGQDYSGMAEHLDYICPMIYPSHYGPGNFGIDYPDTQPYETVYQALLGSKSALAAAQTDAAGQAGGAGQTGAAVQADDAAQTGAAAQTDGAAQAIVRPWLQDFTASYLDTYIEYGDDQVRQQIQAVYDAGYDEWILWDAGVSYHYGGLLTPENAAIEEEQIRSERETALRALPEAGPAPAQQEAETAPVQQEAETAPAQQGA